MLHAVTTLMMYAGAADDASTAMRTGGLPLLPAGVEWPICVECDEPQQFLAHIPLPDGPALEVFMCANDPGMCDAWAPGSGANAVVVTRGEVIPLPAPEDGVTRLDDVTAIALAAGDAAYDYPLPDGVLGQLGGEPAWIQQTEIPDCPECAEAMAFVAQLEEHSSINFGDAGAGYVFACRPCERGTFQYQC
jgi:hypothetical protein